MRRSFSYPNSPRQFRTSLEELEGRAQPALLTVSVSVPALVSVESQANPNAQVAIAIQGRVANAPTEPPATPPANPPDTTPTPPVATPVEAAVRVDHAAESEPAIPPAVAVPTEPVTEEGVSPWAWAAVVGGAVAGASWVLHRHWRKPAPPPDPREWRTYLLGLDFDRL